MYLRMCVCTLTYLHPYVQEYENIRHPSNSICRRLDIRSAFPAR